MCIRIFIGRPNVSHERTGTRGAAGAYAADVPRVAGTLDGIVGHYSFHLSNDHNTRLSEDTPLLVARLYNHSSCAGCETSKCHITKIWESNPAIVVNCVETVCREFGMGARKDIDLFAVTD